MRDKHVATIVLIALCFVVFGISLQAGFLTWDDDFNVTANSMLYDGPLLNFWTRAYYGLYIPLTYTVWGLLAGSGPADPRLFHLVNLVVHTFNCVLVYRIVRGLLEEREEGDTPEARHWGALAAGVLFCVHPLQVGAVAWVSGLRDLLAVAFGLSAAHRYLNSKSRRDDFIGAGLYFAGLLCKPGIVALPAGLFALDVLWRGRDTREALKRIVPFFVLAVPLVVVTKMTQPDEQFTHYVPPLYLRPLIALDALGFYLSKLFWPLHLAVDYGRTPEWVLKENAWIPTLAIDALAAFGLAKLVSKVGRSIWVPLLFSLLILSPVLGFVAFAFQAISTVSDHYLYLPMLGLGLALGTLLARAGTSRMRWIAAAFLVALGVRAALRVPSWKNDTDFYTAWTHDNPQSSKGYLGLGAVAYEAHDFHEAERYFREGLKVQPLNPVAAANLSQALNQQHRFQDVVAEVEPLLRSPPFLAINRTRPYHMSGVYAGVGFAFEGLSRFPEALKTYCAGQILISHDEWFREHIAQVKSKMGMNPAIAPLCPN